MKKPSVTELTSLLDKPALLKWANKIGLEGIALEGYRKNIMRDGASIHKQIENFLLHKTPLENEGDHLLCERFFKDKEILCIEKQVENDHFTGRLDVKFMFNGHSYIADFKSNQKYIYMENKLQLSAYRMIEGAEKVCIISVPDFTMIPIPDIDFEACEEAMILLSELYKVKTRI